MMNCTEPYTVKYQLMIKTSLFSRISTFHRSQWNELFSDETIILHDLALIALKC